MFFARVTTSLLGISIPLSVIIFSAHANTANYLGTASTMGLATALDWRQGAFANFANPSLASPLSTPNQTSSNRWRWAIESSYGAEFFEPFPTLQTEAPGSTGTQRQGPVDSQYEDPWHLGLNLRGPLPLNSTSNIGVSVDVVLPLPNLISINTQEPFRPQYTIHQAHLQQPALAGGVSFSHHQHWHWGVSLIGGWGATGETRVQIAPDATGQASSYQRAVLKSKFAPTGALGVSYRSPRWQSSLSYREKQVSKSTLATETNYVITGTSSSVPLNFTATSHITMSPRQAVGTLSWSGSSVDLGFELLWAQYSRYKSPFIALVFPGDQSKDFRSKYPTAQQKDLWQPKIWARWCSSERASCVSGGYSYYSGVMGLPAANTDGNALDPSKHVLGLGHERLCFGSTCLASIGYHQWISHQVTKNADKIGFPGYKVGGRMFAVAIGVHGL